MIRPKEIPSLLDGKGSKNLFDNIMKLWVIPELEKRKKEGSIDENFTFNKCLIKIPLGKPVIVEFNDKIGWIAIVRKDHESSFKYNDPVHNFQINEILDVKPPTVDDKRVAFVFMHIVKGEWNIFFDFTLNHDNLSIVDGEWHMGKQIAASLQSSLEEQTILISNRANALLRKIGLWPAPALISYPLSKIIKQLAESNETGAIETLVKFCTQDFLEKLQSEWYVIEQFATRKKVLVEALTAHKQSLYTLTIPALLPQVEGIITDWIASKSSPAQIPWRQGSKTKRFQDLILDKPTPETYNIIVNSTIDFILNGPVLDTFKKWFEKLDTAFPNRNVIEHGRYDEAFFNQANSIKLFLLIDTIFHIISENN